MNTSFTFQSDAIVLCGLCQATAWPVDLSFEALMLLLLLKATSLLTNLASRSCPETHFKLRKLSMVGHTILSQQDILNNYLTLC